MVWLRWAAASGAWSWIREIADRMALVTLSRARSASEPSRRGRPPRPAAAVSSKLVVRPPSARIRTSALSPSACASPRLMPTPASPRARPRLKNTSRQGRPMLCATRAATIAASWPRALPSRSPGDYRCVACRADHLPRQAGPPGQQPGHRPPPKPRGGSRAGATIRRRGADTRGHLRRQERKPGRLHANRLAGRHNPAGRWRLIRSYQAVTQRPTSAAAAICREYGHSGAVPPAATGS